MSVSTSQIPRPRPISIVRTFAGAWWPMLIVHAVVVMLVAALLGPLGGILVGALVRLSGQQALSDTAILEFLLSPLGALAGLAIGSGALTLGLLGYAALLIPAQQVWNGQTATPWGALARVARALPVLLRLAARFMLRLLLATIPCAAAIGLIYACLLGEHDINFYLAEKPPVFLLAIALAGLIGLGLAAMLIRIAGNWFHALPLSLLAGHSPREAAAESLREVHGQRREISLSLALWGFGTPLLTSVLNLPLNLLRLWLVPALSNHLGSLALVLGLLILFSSAISFATGFATLSLLAIQHVRLFEKNHPADRVQPARRKEHPRRRVGLAVLVGAAVIITLTTWFTHRWLDELVVERPVAVIAHRGASAEAPENTLAAVELAIDQGADWVEIDVQLHGSGEVLVFHDRDFKRVSRSATTLHDASMESLKTLDIGSWFDPRFAEERTPTLREVLDTCRGRCGVLIELKHYGKDDKLEARVVEEVEAAAMVGQIQLMSLDQRSVRKLRRLRPSWPVGLLSSVALGDLTRLKIDFLGLNAKAATPALIDRAQWAGIEVYVWTINDPVEMSAMASRGVAGLITDRPATACTVLEQRAELNPGARLLVELAARFGKRLEPADP
jgi:glycerophosphoryl diester phosphodiesterase